MPIISASGGHDTLILGINLSGQMKSNLTFDFLFIDVHLTYYYLIQWFYPPFNNLLRKIISWGHFPIAIFLQHRSYQFAMSEANKSSHDWCEPKLWSIVSRQLIEKHFKLKTNKTKQILPWCEANILYLWEMRNEEALNSLFLGEFYSRSLP